MVRILLIDDDDLILQTFSQPVRKFDWHIHPASSGQEGLKVFSEQTWDIVFCDLLMPGLNGFQTLEQIRVICHDQKRRPPARVAITGQFENQFEARLARLEVQSLLLKPFGLHDFVEAVSMRGPARERFAETNRVTVSSTE